MTKRKAVLCVLGAAFVIYMANDYVQFMRQYQKNHAAFAAQTAQIADAAIAVDAMKAILEAQGGFDMDQDFAQWALPPFTLLDGAGNPVFIYQNYYINPPPEGFTPILSEKVVDPYTAIERQTFQINGNPAVIYDKIGLSYLWWQPHQQAIVVIEYDPSTAADEDIVFIAEHMETVPVKR